MAFLDPLLSRNTELQDRLQQMREVLDRVSPLYGAYQRAFPPPEPVDMLGAAREGRGYTPEEMRGLVGQATSLMRMTGGVSLAGPPAPNVPFRPAGKPAISPQAREMQAINRAQAMKQTATQTAQTAQTERGLGLLPRFEQALNTRNFNLAGVWLSKMQRLPQYADMVEHLTSVLQRAMGR